jgi:hypothetical protein
LIRFRRMGHHSGTSRKLDRCDLGGRWTVALLACRPRLITGRGWTVVSVVHPLVFEEPVDKANRKVCRA